MNNAHPNPVPVAVYTMGKVGSSSVTDALHEAGFEALQIHILRGGLRRLERVRAQRPRAQHVVTSIEVTNLIDAGTPPPIISLFREPIARNVSAFFQNHWRLVGGDINRHSVAEAQRLICEQVGPDEPQQWVDKELGEVAHVEIGRHRLFEGAAFAEEARWPTLLLRSDLDDQMKAASLRSFLGNDSISVRRTHATSEKAGGDLYGAVKRAGLPRTYVDACLAQPFVASLLSPEEIEQARQRWTAT